MNMLLVEIDNSRRRYGRRRISNKDLIKSTKVTNSRVRLAALCHTAREREREKGECHICYLWQDDGSGSHEEVIRAEPSSLPNSGINRSTNLGV